MSKKIVDWVADADEYIQSLWTDWDFLWALFSASTTSGTREVAAPSTLGTWDLKSFYLDYTTDDYTHLNYIDYVEWRELYRQGTQTNDKPDQFTITPNHNIYLESIPDATYTITADYWAAPTRLAANADTSPIPDRFERIILARAKIYYSEHDEFPAVYELATAEYNKLLGDLEAAELPGKSKALRRSRNLDYNLVVTPQ